MACFYADRVDPVKRIDKTEMLWRDMKLPEILLWNCLCRGQVMGLKFWSNPCVKGYYPDAYCHEQRLVIEVDGEIHNGYNALGMDVSQHDKDKVINLNKLDINVLRFTNEEVMSDVESVIDKITKFVREHPCPWD